MSLSGKRCIITGGSRGIGLAIAQLFASQGAACTLIGRHAETLSTAVKSLDQESESQAHDTYAFDVSTRTGWDMLLARKKSVSLRILVIYHVSHATVNILIRNRRPPSQKNIDVLVNAAGVPHRSFLFKTGFSEMDEILDVNLRGTIIGCKTIIPKMMKQKSGK